MFERNDDWFLRWDPMKVIKIAATLAVVIAVSACQEIRTLREAQESFNDAAAKENELRYGSEIPQVDPEAFSATSDAETLTAVRVGYANTIASLQSMGTKEKAALEQEGLWGNVLALQATAYWRLGQYDQALESADQAARLAEQLGPRDKAITEALPSLIRNDQAFHKIFALGEQPSVQRTTSLKEASQLLDTAMMGLLSTRQKTSSQHPVQAYLAQSLLVVYLNKRDACEGLFEGLGDQRKCTCSAEEAAIGALNSADTMLKDRTEDRQAFAQYWGNKTGFSAGQEARECQ